MTWQDALLVLTGTLTALLVGLFVAFLCAVNLGLGALGDVAYLSAMQSINDKILNPAFRLIFMGPVLLLPVTTVVFWSRPGRFALLAATLLYIFGVFGITASGNVPLNNRLAQTDLSRISQEKAAHVRGWFEGPWQRLHVWRTLAGIAAVVLIFFAAVA